MYTDIWMYPILIFIFINTQPLSVDLSRHWGLTGLTKGGRIRKASKSWDTNVLTMTHP